MIKYKNKKYIRRKLKYKLNQLVKNDNLNKKIKRTYLYHFYNYYNCPINSVNLYESYPY